MRNSTLKTVGASLAAVAVIVSLGTSPVLARGGGGHGDFGGGGIHFGGGGFHSGGGYHMGGTWNGGYHARNHYYSGYGACTVNPVNQLTYPYTC